MSLRARLRAALALAVTAPPLRAGSHHDPAFRRGQWTELFPDATTLVEHEAARLVGGFNYLLEAARPAMLTLASASMLIIFAAGFTGRLRAPALIATCVAVWLMCTGVLVADFFVG